MAGPPHPAAGSGISRGREDAIEAAQQSSGAPTFTFALQYYGPTLGYLVLMINETYDSFISSAAPS